MHKTLVLFIFPLHSSVFHHRSERFVKFDAVLHHDLSSQELKMLNSELFFINLFILAYFLKTCKGFDNLNEFLAPKSIHE